MLVSLPLGIFYQRIDFEWAGDDEPAFAEFPRKFAFAAFALLRQILVTVEFSIPIDAHPLNCNREIALSEAG